MRLRELTAGCVAWQRATKPQGARADKFSAFALLAEAVVLELGENHVGEAIVDLRGVDIFGAKPRHLEGPLPALDCASRKHVVFLDPALGVVVGRKALDHDRFLLE